MKRLLGAVSLAALYLTSVPALATAQAPAAGGTRDFKADAKALAERIDAIISARWAEAKVKPAPLVDNATFLRRLHLDLAGRIPNVLAVRDILSPDGPSRERFVDQLLASEDYSKHFAAIWRAVMLQGATNNNQAQGLQYPFEQWLRQRLANNTGYDKIVHELILANPNFNNGFGGQAGSPAAFFFASENKAENLAGASSRVFLGVKIECAQCHAHPFAKWTQKQFWEYAAFFSGAQQFGGGRRGGAGNPNSREIKIPNTDKVVQAKFLTGVEPKWQDGVPTVRVLADWMVASDNPYFARAAVDHLWQHFFGISLLEPIMEQTDDSPPTHPALLDEMAKQFIAHNYDLKFLIRAIVQTQAYQRASGTVSTHKDEIYHFARMSVRGMTPEQFFDSLAEATEYNDPYANNPQMRQQQFNGGAPTPRLAFLQKFASQDKRIETHTSILQALFMMNGKFLEERTNPKKNTSLSTIATQPTSDEQRIETLYVLVLSRLPRPDESARMVRYIQVDGPRIHRERSSDPIERRKLAVADVYWALLNSAEFMLNH
jgi:hypothetical protein